MATTRDDHDPQDERPMLVLGENVPDVEDTTPEELRRRAEEAEREIEARRREAEAEIAEQRRQAEAELRRQQLEVDRRERELQREARRLARTGGTVPRASRRSADRSREPLLKRPFHRSWPAAVLALTAAGAMAMAAFRGAGHTDHRALQDFRTSQHTYTEWQQAGLQMDVDVFGHLAGETTVPENGEPPSVGMVKATVARAPDLVPDYYVEKVDEMMSVAVAPDASPVRSLANWQDSRSSAGYAHSVYQVERDRAALTEGSGAARSWSVIALVLLIALLVLAFLTSTLAGAALALLGAVLAGVALFSSPAPGPVAAAEEAHATELKQVRDLSDEIEHKLVGAIGMQPGSWLQDPTYWEWDEDLGVPDGPQLQALVELQDELGRLTIAGAPTEEIYPVAFDYARTAQPVLDLQLEELEAARQDLDAALTRPQDQVTAFTLAALAGVPVALAAYAAGAVQSSRAQTRPDRRKA